MILAWVVAWTQTDIDALKAAVATGVLQVTYAGPPSRSITYRSLPEMQSILASMEREVNGAPGYRRVAFRKGFRDAE